jgi:hypothetical protein
MTKRELIQILDQFYDDDDIFLVSSDEEGNSYREASLGTPEKAYFDGDEWTTLHPEDIEAGEYEDLAEEDILKVGVFW